MQIVEITWIDACSEEARLNIQALQGIKPVTRKNIGFVVEEADTYIILSSGTLEDLYAGEMGFDGVLCIPRKMILGAKKLGKG